MFKQVILLCAFLAVILGQPLDNLDIVEDQQGQQFYLVPLESTLSRQRRQIGGGISNSGFDLSGTGNLVNNRDHRLDGTATVGKAWGGPISAGGTLDYLHKPTSSAASVTATHTPGWGTDVGAQAKYNFYQSSNGLSSASLSGHYDRHYGGPIGNSPPNFGAFLNFNRRF